MTHLSTQERKLAQTCLLRSIQFLWQEFQLQSLRITDKADTIARLSLALTLLETPDHRLRSYFICRARAEETAYSDQVPTASWTLSRGTNIGRLLHCAYLLLRTSSVGRHRESAQLIHEAATTMPHHDSDSTATIHSSTYRLREASKWKKSSQ